MVSPASASTSRAVLLRRLCLIRDEKDGYGFEGCAANTPIIPMSLPGSSSVTTDALAHYPHIPEFYLVARGLSSERVEAVRDALVITPIAFAIVTDPTDGIYALNFADSVVQTNSIEEARALALSTYESAPSNQFARSVIVAAQSETLIGVYQTREAPIAC